MSTWHWRLNKTCKCKTSNAGAWFISIGFSKFHDFSMILKIFQSSMTFHDFSGKFYFSRFSRPCGNPDLTIRQMTLKNNRAPLLCYFKLCASLRSHMWIQTGVTVWKCPIWVKIDNCLCRVTLKFDGWHWKTIGHLFYATSSFVHHFIAICVSNWSYGPETAKLGFDLCDLDLRPLTLTFCMDITLVNDNHCWKFHDDTMRNIVKKVWQTDRQTDSGWTQPLRAAWSQLKIQCSPKHFYPLTGASYPLTTHIYYDSLRLPSRQTVNHSSLFIATLIVNLLPVITDRGIQYTCVWLMYVFM